MPTATTLTLLAIITTITIPAIVAYGNLRDKMATLTTELANLKMVDARQAQDIDHEARRNDAQDARMGTMADMLSRIDTNVQRLVDNDNSLRRQPHA